MHAVSNSTPQMLSGRCLARPAAALWCRHQSQVHRRQFEGAHEVPDLHKRLQALADAEQLHALQARRFTEAGTTASVADGRDGLEQTGIEALRRLFKIAKGHSGQCGRVARFLLGLYNGSRFPFNLTLLRGVDEAIFEDAVRVLRMDALLVRQEVHTYLANGGPEFEKLVETWHMLDVYRLKCMVKELSWRTPFDGPHGNALTELAEYVEDNH